MRKLPTFHRVKIELSICVTLVFSQSRWQSKRREEFFHHMLHWHISEQKVTYLILLDSTLAEKQKPNALLQITLCQEELKHSYVRSRLSPRWHVIWSLANSLENWNRNETRWWNGYNSNTVLRASSLTLNLSTQVASRAATARRWQHLYREQSSRLCPPAAGSSQSSKLAKSKRPSPQPRWINTWLHDTLHRRMTNNDVKVVENF